MGRYEITKKLPDDLVRFVRADDSMHVEASKLHEWNRQQMEEFADWAKKIIEEDELDPEKYLLTVHHVTEPHQALIAVLEPHPMLDADDAQ